MKIGIYGGTFNPPHAGHIKAAGDAVRVLNLDKLLVIPTATPPHKELPEDSAPARKRLEMAQLAFGCIDKAEVCDIELARGGRSYTVDTVAALRENYPGAELWLVMGGDMFFGLTDWYRFDTLLTQVGFAVADRADESEKLQEYAEHMRRDFGAKVQFIPERPVEISSTELRRLLENAEGRELLSPEVYAYIIKNRLYGAKAQLDYVEHEQVISRLSLEDFLVIPLAAAQIQRTHVFGSGQTEYTVEQGDVLSLGNLVAGLETAVGIAFHDAQIGKLLYIGLRPVSVDIRRHQA